MNKFAAKKESKPKLTFSLNGSKAKAGDGKQAGPSVSKASALPFFQDDDDEDIEQLPNVAPIEKISRKRNMDDYLEELKQKQTRDENEPETKMPRIEDNQPASTPYEFYQQGSTNLYLSGIDPSVTEDLLCREFAEFGPIASVKILRPPVGEFRERLSGFVAFMTQNDAEKALAALDGKVIMEFPIKVIWSRPLRSFPSEPIFVKKTAPSVTPVISNLPFGAQLVPQPLPLNATGSPPFRLEVQVKEPKNRDLLRLIHRTIERVLVHGPAFEGALMQRERNNASFRFLFDNSDAYHVYYRWKLYSILQGDSLNQWRTAPFQMYAGGPWWIPPSTEFSEEMADGEAEDEELWDLLEVDQTAIAKGCLSDCAKIKFQKMLRQLTFERRSIGSVMTFTLDHADFSDELVETIFKSLTMKNVEVFPTKLARFYLVSDILHNCGAPKTSIWKLRQQLEEKLPDIIIHLHEVYKSISARLKAENFKNQVQQVFQSWENKLIFPQQAVQSFNHLLTTGKR